MNLFLFDVDGTLTIPQKEIEKKMILTLQSIKEKKTFQGKPFHLGFIGGSDFKKILFQLKEENLDIFDWRLSENGLVTYFKNELVHFKTFIEHLGEEKFQKLINIILKIFSEIEIPKKRGTFIENRKGMINISPIGRQCSQEEREDFNHYDKQHHIRPNIIKKFNSLWKDDTIPLKCSIGGQISIDIFPDGWDKTYYLDELFKKYENIYFFGDKVTEGGNDYEIYNDPRIKGFHVTSPDDTISILMKLFP